MLHVMKFQAAKIEADRVLEQSDLLASELSS